MDYSRRLQQMSGRYNPDNSPLLEQKRYSGETIYDGDIDLLVVCDKFYGTEINKVREELQSGRPIDYLQGPDYPFLSISRINERSAQTNGRLKRMIRFLKNVRTDSDQEINLSSFDINAICYSIPVNNYQNADYKELVSIVWSHMYRLWYANKQDDLRSVVGDEYVFRGKPDKVQALKLLESEVYNIKCDLDKA